MIPQKRTRPPRLVRGALSVWLGLALSGPSPAIALRSPEAVEGAGLEELHDRLAPAAPRAAGLEEPLRELQTRWPTVALVGRPPRDRLTKRLLRAVESVGASVRRLYPGSIPDSRIAQVQWTGADRPVLLVATAEAIAPWRGDEAALWNTQRGFDWPWLEQHLGAARRRALLEGADPLERVPLFRQVYEALRQHASVPATPSPKDAKALETAAFYISPRPTLGRTPSRPSPPTRPSSLAWA